MTSLILVKPSESALLINFHQHFINIISVIELIAGFQSHQSLTCVISPTFSLASEKTWSDICQEIRFLISFSKVIFGESYFMSFLFTECKLQWPLLEILSKSSVVSAQKSCILNLTVILDNRWWLTNITTEFIVICLNKIL